MSRNSLYKEHSIPLKMLQKEWERAKVGDANNAYVINFHDDYVGHNLFGTGQQGQQGVTIADTLRNTVNHCKHCGSQFFAWDTFLDNIVVTNVRWSEHYFQVLNDLYVEEIVKLHRDEMTLDELDSFEMIENEDDWFMSSYTYIPDELEEAVNMWCWYKDYMDNLIHPITASMFYVKYKNTEAWWATGFYADHTCQMCGTFANVYVECVLHPEFQIKWKTADNVVPVGLMLGLKSYQKGS